MYTLFINSVVKNYTILLLDQDQNLVDSFNTENSKLFAKCTAEFLFKHRNTNVSRIIYVNGPGLFNNIRSGYLACKAAALRFNLEEIQSISSLDLLNTLGFEPEISASKNTCYVKTNNQVIEKLKGDKNESIIYTIDLVNNFKNLEFKPLEKINYGKAPNIQKSSPGYIVLSLTLILIMISVPIAMYLSNLNTQTNRLIKSSIDFELAKSEGQKKLKEILINYNERDNLTGARFEINDNMTLHYDIYSEVEQANEALYTVPFQGSGNAGENCEALNETIDEDNPCNFYKLSSSQSIIYNIPVDYPLPKQILTNFEFEEVPFTALFINNNSVEELLLGVNPENNTKIDITHQNLLSENTNTYLILHMINEYVNTSDNTLINSINVQFQSDTPLAYVSKIASGFVEFSNSKNIIKLSQERKPIENNTELGILLSN